ncbi:hypothetical protein M758_UG229100 [Ceratodon purpureus]|nr:hypothetical protein M758_UG229100 [Ceratodon purpureus]
MQDTLPREVRSTVSRSKERGVRPNEEPGAISHLGFTETDVEAASRPRRLHQYTPSTIRYRYKYSTSIRGRLQSPTSTTDILVRTISKKLSQRGDIPAKIFANSSHLSANASRLNVCTRINKNLEHDMEQPRSKQRHCYLSSNEGCDVKVRRSSCFSKNQH